MLELNGENTRISRLIVYAMNIFAASGKIRRAIFQNQEIHPIYVPFVGIGAGDY